MFEDVVAESRQGEGCHVPVDDLDGVLERLLTGADADLDADLDEVPDCPPEGRGDAWSDELVLAYGSCAPSGWLALDLDSATADPARLSDDTLIEAMVGFDRVASWAAARQARLLDELARRRPTDTAPYSARSAGVGSEYAPDEVGVALHLSRGSACARIGLARRLLSTLPATHALWESGRIDTAKARAVDDATVVLSDELARRWRRGCCPGRRSRPWPSSRPRWPVRCSPRIPRAPSSDTSRPGGTVGWWSPPSRTGWARCGRCSPRPTPRGPSRG